MGYLDRLKIQNAPSEEPTKPTKPQNDFQKCPDTVPTKPTKTSNSGFDGFVGTVTGPFQKKSEPNPDSLPDPGVERRRQTVLKMLRENPRVKRAWMARGDTDPVRVHLAVRGIGTCELSIAADRWDEFKFLELLEKQEGTA
jgi:hypothetical protein